MLRRRDELTYNFDTLLIEMAVADPEALLAMLETANVRRKKEMARRSDDIGPQGCSV